MIVQVEPVEIGGKLYVAVVIDDLQMGRHGPFDADTAEIVVGRLSRVARALTRGGSDDG